MPQLIVTRQDGSLLFDTSKITYGLVRSGYLTFIEAWQRRSRLAGNNDPNAGTSWTATTASQSLNFSDALYGFTIVGAKSPIVFITGSGCLEGTKVSGDAMTFLYGNVDANTKFYCFDLMQDIFPGSPFLKTRSDQNEISFNSLQNPLNVISAVQAPPYQGTQQTLWPPPNSIPYVGGVISKEQFASNSAPWLVNRYTCRVNIPLLAGVEYAAYLPWSRGCSIWNQASGGERGPTYRYGGSEGCAGRVGGIQFQFGPAAGSPADTPVYYSGVAMPPAFSGISTDRYPVALAITTANLPFPFN